MKMLLICVLIAASLFVEIKNKSANTHVKPSAKASSGDSIPPYTVDFTTPNKTYTC